MTTAGKDRSRAISAVGLSAALVLTGLSAGFFFTYQFSILPALERVDATTYVATFQAINDTIGNPAFARSSSAPYRRSSSHCGPTGPDQRPWWP